MGVPHTEATKPMLRNGMLPFKTFWWQKSIFTCTTWCTSQHWMTAILSRLFLTVGLWLALELDGLLMYSQVGNHKVG